MSTYLRKGHIIKLNSFKASSMPYSPKIYKKADESRAIKMP
jgi:hypothetical protein